MKKIITLTKKTICIESFDEESSVIYDLKDVGFIIEDHGLMRADYLLEVLKDYKNIPNRIK